MQDQIQKLLLRSLYTLSSCKNEIIFSVEYWPSGRSRVWIFWWGTYLYISLFLSGLLSVCPSVLHTLSQEPYIMWSQFLLRISKMMISQQIFSFFQNSAFSLFLRGGGRGRGGQKCKKWPIITNFSLFTLYISGTVDHIIKNFGTQV